MDGKKSAGAPGRTRRPGRLLHGPRPEAVPVLAAHACALAGLLDIAAGVFPGPGPGPGPAYAGAGTPPGALGPLSAALSLSAGVLLLLLAPGLRRREHRAWRAAVVLLPAGAAAQCVYRPSPAGLLAAAVPLALLAPPLLRHRERFTAPPGRRSRWRALAHFVLMGAGSLVLGLAVAGVHPRRGGGDLSLADRLTQVMYGLVGVAGPVDYDGSTSWTVACSLGALGLLTVVTTLHLALRPGPPAARLTGDDAARLRALLAEHGGRDPFGPCAARRGTAVVFSPSGRAAVTYRVVAGVMLADGDPVGDVEAWPGAIERFMDEARAHSWTPAVTGCSARGGEVWAHETGLDSRITPDTGTGTDTGTDPDTGTGPVLVTGPAGMGDAPVHGTAPSLGTAPAAVETAPVPETDPGPGTDAGLGSDPATTGSGPALGTGPRTGTGPSQEPADPASETPRGALPPAHEAHAAAADIPDVSNVTDVKEVTDVTDASPAGRPRAPAPPPASTPTVPERGVRTA
ncbi:phosphatidylglycerol lysyltransferase domain-containing protein [Streptomyces minutiscleroticus]|uniref:phosphatidylglycerol lysyltransferase domain-containing protein n=1 Tax=Streptomyces minutiscleroticus TaxID=68238 RepID=UPI00331CF55A